MKCKEIKRLLALYGSGELSPEEQEMAETHLASCERCRQEVSRLNKVPALIQSLHGDAWWADVSSPVMERLNAYKAQSGRPQAKALKAEKRGITRRLIWQPALISLLVVAIFVGAIAGLIYPGEGPDVFLPGSNLSANISLLDALCIVGLTLVGSIVIAYTTLWLQGRIGRRRLHRSLLSEIVANLSLAESDLRIINGLEAEGEFLRGTYFDISPLQTISYQDFRLSGEALKLSREIMARVEEVYELLNTHNRQVSFLTVEFPPRTEGMSKRLESIIEKLRLLITQCEKSRIFE